MKLLIAISAVVLVGIIFNEVAANEEKYIPTHKFVRDSLNELYGKENAMTYRCELQCHCDHCSKDNPAFASKCTELLPKRRIPNCKCQDEHECPDPEHLDENCMLYCFCKKCGDDPRMIPELQSHCHATDGWVQTCECKDLGDCNVLDAFKNLAEKKGKLKSKQYDREL